MKLDALGRSATNLVRPAARTLRRSLVMVAVAALVFGASGCATTGGTNDGLGLVRPPDPYCNAEYQALKKFDDVFAKALAVGAMAGVTAGLISGDWRVGLITAIAATATASYAGSLRKKEEAARRDLYIKDVSGENVAIDGTTRAWNTLANCRFAAADEVREKQKAGLVGTASARDELAKLETLFKWDVKLGRKVQVRIDNRGGQFAEASTLVGGPGPQPMPATRTLPAVPKDLRETHKWSNVRSGPGTDHSKVATLEPRTQVELLGPAEGARSWSRIRLEDGREVFIASNLLVKPGEQPATSPTIVAAKPAEPVPVVTAVTQSNQVKRQAYAESIDGAEKSAQVHFKLDEEISLRHRPQARA